MKRERESLSPRMLSLAVFYGLGLRWPWPLQPGDYCIIRKIGVEVTEPGDGRIFYLPLNSPAPAA